MVPLADPQEVDNLPVQVIEYFNFGGALVKKNLRAAGKGFHVGVCSGSSGMILAARRFLPPM